jgi:hypothetical protein
MWKFNSMLTPLASVRIGQGSLSAVSDTGDKPQQKETVMREAEGGAHA